MCVLQCDHGIINMNNLSEQELVYVHVDIYIYRIIKHQSHHTRLFLARNACTYLFIQVYHTVHNNTLSNRRINSCINLDAHWDFITLCTCKFVPPGTPRVFRTSTLTNTRGRIMLPKQSIQHTTGIVYRFQIKCNYILYMRKLGSTIFVYMHINKRVNRLPENLLHIHTPVTPESDRVQW